MSLISSPARGIASGVGTWTGLVRDPRRLSADPMVGPNPEAAWRLPLAWDLGGSSGRAGTYRPTSNLTSGDGRSVLIRTERPRTMPTTSANCPTLLTFGSTSPIVWTSSADSGSRVTMWRWRSRHSNVATLSAAATTLTL